ncbi:MAG: peptidoglycan-binding protein [Coleofasciculus sp. Co-bin14]|nr:peptidoglycan-binding protein [Coleofasciculus sp. Co-bin14]
MKSLIITNNSIIPTPAQSLLNKPLLHLGSVGVYVLELQNLLMHYGTYSGSLDGNFDGVVKNAVIAFQNRVFLLKDGIVGRLTWQSLYSGAPITMPVLQHGNSETAVITLQNVLRQTGDFRAELNGNFDPSTEAAVRAFQKRKGLVIDGIVGFHTWYALSKVPHHQRALDTSTH